MSHIPAAWKDVKIDRFAQIDIKADGPEKRKRRRQTPKSKSLQPMDSKVEQAKSGSVKDGIYSTFECTQPPKKKNKQVVVDTEHSRKNEEQCNSNIKENVMFYSSNLPKQPVQMEHMISGMSKTLQQIVTQSSYRCTLKGVDVNNITYTNDIRAVSKKYEDSYLRQRLSANERSCVRGVECECMFIDTSQGFVGVEYVLPWEEKNTKNWGMCLPCLRATTQILFYDIVHSGAQVNGLIQRFYNEHSKPGEYRLSAMLVCPPSGPLQNLPMPIVRHQRNAYKVINDKSIFYMQQVEVDFR
jgi:hypothetical protein